MHLVLLQPPNRYHSGASNADAVTNRLVQFPFSPAIVRNSIDTLADSQADIQPGLTPLSSVNMVEAFSNPPSFLFRLLGFNSRGFPESFFNPDHLPSH